LSALRRANFPVVGYSDVYTHTRRLGVAQGRYRVRPSTAAARQLSALRRANGMTVLPAYESATPATRVKQLKSASLLHGPADI